MMDKANEQLARDKEVAKGLVGKIIKLSPTVPFFFEDNGNYVLNAQPEIDGVQSEFQNSTVVIKEGWKLECTLRNVRAGQLRVVDEKGNDISEQFGGPAAPLNRKARAIVAEGMPQFNKDDQRDVKLKGILDNIDEREILKVIESNRLPYALMERLLQLELAGENPAYRSRRAVVDGIKELMKRSILPGGELVAKKLDAEEDKVTTARG